MRTRIGSESKQEAPHSLEHHQQLSAHPPKPRNVDVPTSAISFVETQHGRLRRKQRGIDKKDLQAAIKHGTRYNAHPRRNGDVCSKYVHNDITYIVNEVTREEVTSYAKPLELRCVPTTFAMQARHERAVERIQNNLDIWTSNTVIVVDTSGSMREGDVWGTRNRLGAVWVSIALDFLAHRLESGEACETDVISIVTMEERPSLVVREMPSTWILYNQLICIYEEGQVLPSGHGPFLPSLKVAQELLTRNPNAACALSLTFLSDGAPSDFIRDRNLAKAEWNDRIVKEVEDLATMFGRRLAFTTIGVGSRDEFGLLNRMAEAAADYGVKAAFRLPSMTSSSLGQVFTSVASVLTSTQTEMTDLDTLKQRKVRRVSRESKTKASEASREVSDDDFWIYPRNRVVRLVYKEWLEGRERNREFSDAPLQADGASYVALSKCSFGEGAERNAFRFYEVATDRKTIVGKALVAKESRMILASEKSADEKARWVFVKTFCSTQQLARRLADEFNQKLEKSGRVDPRTPTIAFLDCTVYQLVDKNFGKASVLVEEKLDHMKWHKWNANNGYVDGMNHSPTFSPLALSQAFKKVEEEELFAIEEGSEDEEDEEECNYQDNADEEMEPNVFSASEVAQAFSHFTYWATGRKRLVCDLQGVYDEGARILRLTDPVIHYHNPNNRFRNRVHGDTDRGKKGVAMFFGTHKCCHLCSLVLRGMRRSNASRHARKSKPRS
jgi:Alpha-kinase family